MLFFQDNQGTISFLENQKIENIICIHWLQDKAVKEYLDLIWIQVKNNNYWLRFFLDVGLCFGEKYSLPEFKDVYLEDIDNAYIYSFSDRNGLNDLTIISAEVNSLNSSEFININGVKLSLFLSNNQIIEFCSNSLDVQNYISLK